MTASVAQPTTAAPPRRRTSSRWWITAVLAALVFVAATVAVFVVNLDTTPTARPGAQAPAVTPSPGLFPGEQQMGGDDLLLAMAARVSGLPADRRTGTYELMHSIIFNPEIQGPVRAVEQQTWHLPDGTARYAIQRSRTLPSSGFDPITASLDFTGSDIGQIIQDDAADPELVHSPDIVLTAGDPTVQLDWYLAAQRHGPAAPSSVRIQELISLYHDQIVPPALRAAILRLLAQLPDVAFTHQHSTDLLHRNAIAFNTDVDGRDLTLIIDPVTGTLNAVHEQFYGRLFAYTLFYPSQWADHRGPTHPAATPISTIAPHRPPRPPPTPTPGQVRTFWPPARSLLRYPHQAVGEAMLSHLT